MKTSAILVFSVFFLLVVPVQSTATCDNPLYLTFADSHSSFAQHPEVQGTNIVFSENGNIYLLDLARFTLKEITADGGNSEPVISGNRVAWVHNNPAGTLTTPDNSSQIRVYDIQNGRTRSVTNGTGARSQPAISGDIIVWTDSRNGNLDIYAYDFARENEIHLSKNTADQNSPAIYGKKVVWRDELDINHSRIYMYDLETLEIIPVSGADSLPKEPGIFGNWIIWTGGHWGRIYTYDLSTKKEGYLESREGSPLYIAPHDASIYKDRVVWHDTSRWQADTYSSKSWVECMNSPAHQNCGPVETQGPKYQSVVIYDLTKKTDTAVFTKWKLSLSALRPRLSDDFLVWQEEGSVAICPMGSRKIDGMEITRIPHPSRANLIVAQPALLWKKKFEDNTRIVAAISGDGKFIAAGDSPYRRQNISRVLFYSASGDTLWEYPVGSDIYSIALSSNGEYLAAGGFNSLLYLFNQSGMVLWKYGESDHILNNTVSNVAISRNGSTIAASCDDGYQYIFSRDGKVLSKNKKEGDGWGMALTGDGAFIAQGYYDGKVFLTTVNGTRVWISAINGGIQDIAISRDGSRIVAGNGNGTIVLLDRSGKILWHYAAGKGNIAVAISDDGKYIAARGGNSDIYFLNSDGVVIWKYDPRAVAFGWDVSLSGDGTLLVAPDYGNLYLFRTDGTGPAGAPVIPGSATTTQKSPLSYASAGAALVIMIGLIGAGKIRRH